jgi:heme/copper-type cytochrome/quinol oxidase subunit 2
MNVELTFEFIFLAAVIFLTVVAITIIVIKNCRKNLTPSITKKNGKKS